MKKTEILICLGSSCFSRGNKKSVHIIKSYLKENQLECSTYFHGSHCFGDCENGPILQIGNEKFTNISPETIIPILDAILKKS